jgi:hypothetical protein
VLVDVRQDRLDPGGARLEAGVARERVQPDQPAARAVEARHLGGEAAPPSRSTARAARSRARWCWLVTEMRVPPPHSATAPETRASRRCRRAEAPPVAAEAIAARNERPTTPVVVARKVEPVRILPLIFKAMVEPIFRRLFGRR